MHVLDQLFARRQGDVKSDLIAAIRWQVGAMDPKGRGLGGRYESVGLRVELTGILTDDLESAAVGAQALDLLGATDSHRETSVGVGHEVGMNVDVCPVLVWGQVDWRRGRSSACR